MPDKNFLRDSLIGLIRCGRPIVCQMARQLPNQRVKFLSRLDRLEAHLVKDSNFDNKIKAELPHTWLPSMQDETPIILDLSDIAKRIGIIRATTIYAYLDTPWRFKKKNQLWKYCGVGLQHSASGKDAKGRPRKGTLELAWRVNKMLKNAVMGAAMSAIRQKDNEFAHYYERMLKNGIIPGNARHSVARRMASVLWGIWKQQLRQQKTEK